ncbi:MAG: hypothetical protein AB7N76_01670 [Planctomycetota bacterium]
MNQTSSREHDPRPDPAPEDDALQVVPEERQAREQLEAVLDYIRRESAEQPLVEVQRGVLTRLVTLAGCLSRCLDRHRDLQAVGPPRTA